VKKQDILENLVNYAYLGIGSNLGKKIYNLELTKFKLSEKGIYIDKSSSFYCTKSWPNPKFPDYVNAVLLINTSLSLIQLFKEIKLIEKTLGRTKTPKNYPRKCDIDIIDFNGKFHNFFNIDLTVPHPRMDNRNFVLLPLFEINKNWVHPKTKKNIVNLISKLKGHDIRSMKFI
tara:strand:- start:140 stop:661 length:522 start_codon:yes stop_codon:yes gene_type:complete